MKKLLSETLNNPSMTIVESNSTNLPKGVLLRVSGQVGLYDQPTLNGRSYPKQLWVERVIGSPDIAKKMQDRNLFGEADHPQELEVSIHRISHAISKIWLDESTNRVMGTFDILDTPAGRIVKTLYDYGAKVGVSSRGSGEIHENNGISEVRADTYEFITFDFVTDPANVGSYPTPVMESLARRDLAKYKEDMPFYEGLFHKLGIDLSTLQEKAPSETTEGTRESLWESRLSEMAETLKTMNASLSSRSSEIQAKDIQIIGLQETVASLRERLLLADSLLESKSEPTSAFDGEVVRSRLNAIEERVRQQASQGAVQESKVRKELVQAQQESQGLREQVSNQRATILRLQKQQEMMRELRKRFFAERKTRLAAEQRAKVVPVTEAAKPKPTAQPKVTVAPVASPRPVSRVIERKPVRVESEESQEAMESRLIGMFNAASAGAGLDDGTVPEE